MHQPRPYGLHAIGLPLTERDEAFIASVAKRITNLKELSKVDSMKMVYDLPDGGYVIVQDMGGNFRVISHKPIHGKDPIFDGVETDYIPMLFSGVVTNPMVFETEEVKLRLTEAARFRLVNYKYLETKPSKDIDLRRFRINYNEKFSEFKPKNPNGILHTQYAKQKPTWYSGAMAEVMQIVGGYGRQDFANLPDEKTNKFERAQILLPKQWRDRVNEELTGLRLPAYTGLPPADGSFQFDYKFNNTNAVGFDDKKRPWLLQVGVNGVYSMPLPIVPATRTSAFRRYMQLVGDEEILAILDRFGGMPSGESFPNPDNFEAWRRAGVIIKICDTSDFYSHIAYSSACGWSLNSKGTEGYNTCYDYYDDEGLGYGLTYKLRLTLVSTDQYFGAEPVELVDSGPIADKVRLYLSQLIPTLNSSDNSDKAILYKLRRARSVDIYQRALGRAGDNDRDYWHNLEMDPIAKHVGNVTEVYRGYLYHGAKFKFQPQIKFPEPLVNACISHDFLPLDNGLYKKSYPNSDTIMLAYYVGNNLKVVKYFVDWNTFKRKEIGNFERYMRVGSWYNEESTGDAGVQGYFYSTDIDDREIVAPTITTTTIEGVDKGFDNPPAFAADALYYMCGDLFRNRYYTHEVKTIRDIGKQLDVAICVPFFCRNAIFQYNRTIVPIREVNRSLKLYWVRDPTKYRYWTFDPVFAYQNMTIANPKGKPDPRNGVPVWAEEKVYKPTTEQDFADFGDWLPSLPQDMTWLIHPDNNSWLFVGGGSPPKIEEYAISERPVRAFYGLTKFVISDQPITVNREVPDDDCFFGSPTEGGNYFYRDAINVVFGDTIYYNMTENGTDKATRAFRGSCSLVDHKAPHHFIGVINE